MVSSRKPSEHDRREIQEAKLLLKEMNEFREWKATLTKEQWNQFVEQVKCNGRELVFSDTVCPDPVYKKWGRWAIKHLLEDAERELQATLTPKEEKVKYVKRQGQTRDHHCHFPGCGKQCPPAAWGCKSCWFKLPKYLRDKIWASFRPGQETNWTPSREYVKVAREVQEWIKAHYNEDGSRKEA